MGISANRQGLPRRKVISHADFTVSLYNCIFANDHVIMDNTEGADTYITSNYCFT